MPSRSSYLRSLWERFIFRLFRKRRAEAILLESFRASYPDWVKSGLVKPREHSTSLESHPVLSGKTSKQL